MTTQAKRTYQLAIELFCRCSFLPLPVTEYQFAAPMRKWAFDFAWPDPSIMVALEVDGGIWTGGRHTRGKGFEADCEKLNEATARGWHVLRATPQMLKKGEVWVWLEQLLEREQT